MKIKDTFGIDMSKLTFDACIHSNQTYKSFDNKNKGYKQLVEWAYKNSEHSQDNIVFIFEYNGLYSHGLATYFISKNISFPPMFSYFDDFIIFIFVDVLFSKE
jgi:transposase